MAHDGTLRRATAPLLKELNERAVLEAIRGGAPISRAEIARRTGISKPTVSLALRALVAGGLVRETSPQPGRPHYGALFFEPVPEAALVLALDIGARFVRGALADIAGNVRARQDAPLPRDCSMTTIQAAASVCAALVDAAGVGAKRIDGAVVGVPGVVAPDDTVTLATNVPGIEEPGFARDLRETLGVPVRLENDINLAALGEQSRGVARGVADFLFLSIGTGMGAGLILRGELHRGRNGAAGELDYAFVGVGPDADPAAPAFAELTGRLAAAHEGATTLLPPYDPRDVFAAARAGDGLAQRAVAEEARRIALHVLPVAAVADVELVVLGGGLGANGDLLLEPIRRRLVEALPFPPRVEVSALGEAAVLTGALATGVRAARENLVARRE
ncbi:MAG TPA: ROK family transcriptional regulator [Gaiellaceae bacterium]|nr:ROK family transcriptional regulator [Gaiellaceae bacterium]